jgi:electron transport complex protein RnfB
MLSATLLVAALAVAFGAALIWLAHYMDRPDEDLVDELVARLPRIQCGQCGYPGCRPYAEAILADEAEINQCPPGGEATIVSLAELLGRERKPLDSSRGTASWERVASIDEATCIGCNLCARACPVDAIVGAFNWMHTVIADQCTGCELCVAPCPVDCITMLPRPRSLTCLTDNHA